MIFKPKKILLRVIAALAALIPACLPGALVDTDGNAATNQTLLGDIDMGVGTLGDLKTFVSTGAVEEAKNFTRTNAVMWHDNVASNITVGPVDSIGFSSLSFSDEDGNGNIGSQSISFGWFNSVGDNSSAFGDNNSLGERSSAFGSWNNLGHYSFAVGSDNYLQYYSAAVGERNEVGDYGYAFGYNNYARIYDGVDGGYFYKNLAFLMGVGNLTEADGSFLMGVAHHAGEYAQASFSFGTTTEALHPGAFVWSFYPTNFFDMFVEDIMALPRYQSHGIGSFNINPVGGLSNFWVGETNMSDHVVNIVAPLAMGIISDLESGNIIPYKTDNLRSANGDTNYTATDLLIKATNASVFAVNELARTNSVLANGPYVQQSTFTNTVKAIVTNAVPSWSDWAYSGDVTAGVTYNIISSQNGGGYSFRLYDFATDTLLATAASLEEHPATILFSVTGGTITATRTRAYYSDVTAVDGKVNAVSNWVENMDTSYFRTNVAVAAAATRVVCPSNQNQTVQYINAPSGVSTIEISLPKDGMTKDWLVYILATDEITLVLPPANYWATSESVTNKIEASTATALYFSQISDNIYSIGRQDNLVPITIQDSGQILMQSIREKSKTKRRLVR